MPGAGLISERSHTAGENIHSDAFGCVRPVFDLNGHNTVRLWPSGPTASLTLRILSRAWRSCRRSSSCGQPFDMSSNTFRLITSLPLSVRGQPIMPSRSSKAPKRAMLNVQPPSRSRT
jgi:hypothetical protein